MGSYVGEIQISRKNNGVFVNFYPGYQYKDGKFNYLYESDILELLPGSQYLNVNLFSSSQSCRLEDLFQDGDDVIIDFTESDLIENTKGDGGRYPTAWKLDISRMYGQAVRHMDDIGLYCVLEPQDVCSDWHASPVVELDSPNIIEGMMVLIPSGEENTLIGPYKVRYDEEKETYYLRTNMDQKKSLISGFTYEGGVAPHRTVLVEQDVTRTYVPIMGAGILPYAIDQISDAELVESFRLSLSKKMVRSFHLDPANVDHLLDIYSNSLLAGSSIPEKVAAERCKRLKNMFSSELRFTSTLDSIASALPGLMRLYRDDPSYKEMLSSLARDPEFVEHLDLYDDFVSLKKRLQNENAALEQKKDELAAAVAELETINPQQRLTLYRDELARLEKMKAQAEAELHETHRRMHLGSALSEMENRSQYLDEEIQRKETKISQLDEQMEGLQKRLDSILEESSRRSLEISFDNMISERFMEHAARQEYIRRMDLYQRASRAIRSLSRSCLSDEQLVDALVHAFKCRRPEYSRNEILNILICVVRGFLTIFSGAPGSGKTSVCRILCEVLSLSEPAKLEVRNPDFPYCSRYVPVSVERGWTSRRDLVGFYNSLTRTFDKADARLFDLLSILNQEARGSSDQDDLPALVLLDDANLSSMEYYWADFMTMEENTRVRGTLSLGENYMLQIPHSLHFAASIQSDHTTEPLSLRLLDRAWVISMPEKKLSLLEQEYPDSGVAGKAMVTEAQLESVFSPVDAGLDLPARLEELLSATCALFEEAGLPLSIRSETAVRGYVLSAMRWFEQEDDDSCTDEGIIALDFAVLQRLLPRISGSSERFRASLEKMRRLFDTNGMKRSSAKLSEIMDKGDGSMQFYQFFS